MKQLICLLPLFLLSQLNAQNCGIKNASFETYSNCPTTFSQFNRVNSWYNALNPAVSTPDYFSSTCGFTEFDASGTIVTSAPSNTNHNWGAAGLFLNYNDGVQDPKYKEYIGQAVELKAGRTYNLSLELWKSNNNTTDDLERNFVIYGYNGAIPASNVDFCVTGAVPLDSILTSAITITRQTLSVSFTPTIDYSNIIFGASCDGTNAIQSGYVFIDRVDLTSTNDSTLTPIIESLSFTDSNDCFSKNKQDFLLTGNTPPTGATVTWGQSASNPETVSFSTINNNSTSISGVGQFTAGDYQFSYTFSNGSCSVSDTFNVEIVNLPVNAGSDIIFCNGNNDNPFGGTPLDGSNTRVISMNATPDTAFLNPGNYAHWWSMIRADGSEWTFTNPCVPFNGTNEGTVSNVGNTWVLGACGTDSRYNSPTNEFNIFNPQDSINFIWHVIDKCGTEITDTVLVVMNDIDLDFGLFPKQVCAGDTITVYQADDALATGQNPLKLNKLIQKANLKPVWTSTLPGIQFLDPLALDSSRIVIPSTTGAFSIRLTITDTITGCVFYDELSANITNPVGPISAGTDLVFCNGNNDLNDTVPNRAFVMNASPSLSQINTEGFQTWWSMIRADGSEWVFTNPCVPFDGENEGRAKVASPYQGPANCGNIDFSFRSSSPEAAFIIKNPQDSIYFIWNVSNGCGSASKDTMLVVMNDIDIAKVNDFSLYCPGDTITVTQTPDTNFAKIGVAPNLTYNWSSLNGSFVFLNNGVADSARVIINNAVDKELITVTVTDANTGCTWFDNYRLNIEAPIAGVDAGTDITTCNTSSNYFFSMAASPSITNGNGDYCSWWSMIRADSTEWIFSPGSFKCGFAGDGVNEGDAFILGNGSRSNAQFMLSNYGNFTFIWHVYSACNDSTYIDTVQVNWGYDEPIFNAGPDQTPVCNTTELLGNISGSTAGNSGCYQWSQISGPGTLTFLNPNQNVAYITNLDNTTPGSYEVGYQIGCEPCIKRDTMLLTVNSGLSGNNNPILGWNGTDALCFGDSILITSTGADEYAWIENNQVVKPFSVDSTFNVMLINDTSRIRLLTKTAGCISTIDTTLTLIPQICTTVDTIYTTIDTCVSTSEMPFGWDQLISCDSLNTKIGASFTITDTCITYSPIVNWTTDTLCVVLQDTTNNINDTTIIIFLNNDSTFNVVCNDTSVYINVSGTFTLDTSYVLDSIDTKSGVDSVWLSKYDITCGAIDSVYVIARSDFGVLDSCKAYITIIDTIKPTINCMDSVAYLNGSGLILIDTSYVLQTLNDNCNVATVTLSKQTFSCSDLGLNTIWVIATDDAGNKDSCQAQIIVRDTLPPEVTCIDRTFTLNATGIYTLTIGDILGGVTDNCGVSNFWTSDTILTCSPDTNYVNIYATDFNGNIDSCEAQVIVIDNLAPTLTCKDTSIYLNNTGQAIIDSSFVLTSFNDNCEIDSVWLSRDTFNCMDDTTQVTIYATDKKGNIDSCTAQVIVIDTIKPILSCKNTTVFIDTNGQAIVKIDSVLNSATDICGIDSLWISDSIATCIDDSLTIIIYALDNNGNIDSCSAKAYVTDTTAIQPLCRNRMAYLNSAGLAIIDSNFIDSSSNASCTIDSMYMNINSLDCSNLGTNNSTLYIKTVNGKIDSCTSTITVLDTLKPTAICIDTTLYIGNLPLVIDSSFVNNGSFDNCNVATMTLSRTTFDCSNIDTNKVTLYVTDASGNIDSCVANVIILDTIKPTVNCKDTSIYIGTSGSFTIDSSYIDNGTSDNCSFTTRISKSIFTCADVGLDTVWYYATDSSGNIDSCMSTITVLDTIKPIASCRDITISIANNGVATINPLTANNGSTDNCPLAYRVRKPTYSCAEIGTFSNWLYATDPAGNEDSCMFNVTVIDQTPPTPSCLNIIVYLDGNGNATIDTNAIDGGSTDNCGIVKRSLSQTSFTCNNIGNNVVTLYLTDSTGNIDSCSANVSVIDSTSPVINCPNDIVQTVSDINCIYTIPDFSNQFAVNDNCSNNTLTITQTPPAGTEIIANTSAIPVSITLTDGSLNSVNCSYNIILTCVQEIVIPNVFSPNNDGKNETLSIPQLTGFPDNTFKIFNRWGKLLYEEKGYVDGWSGTDQSGKKLSPGVYYYIINLGVEDIEDQKGTIQLFK